MSILTMLSYNIIPFIVILSLLVFVHELGHYMIARYNKVKVETFSIGFGPEVFGWTDRHQTRWKISLIPLGGYVKMFSDLNAASQPDAQKIQEMTDEEKAGSLYHKSVGQRMAVTAAGPGANYIFAILILSTLYIFSGQRVTSDLAKIGHVLPASIAETIKLQPGDVILDIDGKKVNSFLELHEVIQNNPNQELTLHVQRADNDFIVKAKPQLIQTPNKNIGRLGITPFQEQIKRSPIEAIYYAINDVYELTTKTLHHMGQMIVGNQSTDGLSGPLGIAALTGEVARKSIVDLIWLMALLSVNLGLINLFPVPMLDGGHLLFYFIEAIRGKPVPEKIQEWGYRIGFGLVIMLVVLSTWNDILHLKVFEFFSNLFH